MELRDIEYFAVVAEHRHLGRAAEALGITQPALSKCLRRLEATLDAKLVRRTPKGIDLTAEGAALASRAGQLRLSLDDVAREVRNVNQGRVGHLRIGAATGMVERLLPASCSVLVKEAPHVMITVIPGVNETLLPALRNGELELIISGIPDMPYEDLVQMQLYDDEFAVFASKNHPLAERRKVTIGDLTQVQWVTSRINSLQWRWLQGAFENHGLPRPRAALETSALSLASIMVASSDLLWFTAKRHFEVTTQPSPLVEISVKELKWKRHVGVSYRKNAYLSPVARRFLLLLDAEAKKSSGKRQN